MQIYEPFLMQQKFHQCPADEIFLGGAAGPGKTRALLEDAIDRCRDAANWKDARFIYFRGTYDELLKVIDDSKKIIARGVEAEYNETLHRWTFFASGAYLRFDSLHNLSAADSHLSEEYDGIYMDECGQLDPKMHHRLRARNRTTGLDAQGLPRKPFWRGASNPGGVAHMELLKRYVKPVDYEARLLYWWDDETYEATGYGWVAYPPDTFGKPRDFDVWQPSGDAELKDLNAERSRRGLELAKPRTRCFIPGRLEDNPILYNDPTYDATLWDLAGNDPTLYRAMRKGDWFAFDGQVFIEFNRETHVIPPIIPKAHWPRWRSFDWGYTAPFTCYWHTLNVEEGIVITYREETGTRCADGVICERIKDATPIWDKPPSGRWRTAADPSMWANLGRDDALSRAQIFENHGVPLHPANNDRKAGKARVHELLAIDLEKGSPNWLITANCTYLIESLPSLTYNPKKPEDVDTDGDDHGYDAVRYGLMDLATDEPSWGPGMRRAASLRKAA